jgi:hypothetical protein
MVIKLNTKNIINAIKIMIMNSSIKFTIITTIFSLALGAILLPGCKKEANNSYEVYGAVDSLKASFTVSPVQGSNTKFVVTNTTAGSFVGTYWDSDQGNKFVGGKAVDTIFYPLAGTYNIKMQVLDKRGRVYTAAPTAVTTTVNDPRYVLKGGQMRPGDDAYWSIFNQGPRNGIWTLANGLYTVTNNPNNTGIYQAVQLVGGKKYNVSITYVAKSFNSTWGEVWIGKFQPVNGSDYGANAPSSGNGTSSTPTFVGWSSSTTTESSGTKTGSFTPATSGTYYFTIKVGTGNSFTSVAISNVSLYSDY